MKVGFLAGGNCHALAAARVFSRAGIDCFGIGRGAPKSPALWFAPEGYRYYRAHVGKQNAVVFDALDHEKPDTVVSFLAQGEGAASFGAEAWRFYQTNCAYLAQLVETLRKRPYIERFVQVSTSELYGATGYPADESFPVVPTSPYAISKAAFDAHLAVMHRVHGFPIQIVRPSNCVTQGMQLHRIVPRALMAAVGGRRLKLEGGGMARKSFLHSEDLGTALALIIEKGPIGQVFNVGPDYPVSVREVVELCAQVSGVPFDDFVDVTPARVGEDAQYWLNSDKVKSLGWSQTISLKEAIERMYSWVRMYRDELLSLPDSYVVTP